MPKFVNPYQARTPLGQSLNAVATALFSGPNARELDAIEADAEQKRLHGLLYGEQTRKARFEADAQEQANRMRSPESMTESAALLHGVPTSNVQGLIDYSGGRVAMPPAMPGGIDPRMVAETLFAQRAGAGDKTSSATEVATARSRLGMDRNREDVISGRLSPTVAAQAMYPEKGHAPFTQNAQGSMLNVVEGRQDQSSPLAVANIGSENAQALQRRAAAGASGAAAGASNAHAGLYRSQTAGQDLTNSTGVTAGAPVVAINPDSGKEELTPPRIASLGRAPGAKPLAPEVAGLREAQAEAARARAALDDEKAKQGGFAPRAGAGRTAAPRRITTNDRTLLDNAIKATLEEMNIGNLDDATRNAILKAAEAEWQGGAAGHQTAAMAAINAVAPGGFEDTRAGIPLVPSKFRAKGGAQSAATVPAAAPAAAPKAAPAGGAVPPPAQREAGKTYRTPSGPMKWNGRGWLPPDA